MTESVELATGYISLAATTKGLGRQVSREFAGIERDADRTGKRSGKRFGLAFGGVLKAGALGAAVAGVVAARGIDAAIDSASGLEQSVGGVKSVFKGYAKVIDKESRGAAKSVGLSKNAYNELATVIGASLKNKGVKNFGKETQNLIGLGADMAAQFGGSTKDAVEAIGAALRGESDPIERYGVSLNESAVNAVLAAKGQDKLKGAALDQAKAQARLKILFDQTTDAQGAFGRESDTHAGKLQRAAAGWENVKAKIGELFLPTATKALGFISDKLLPGLERLAVFLSANVGPAFEKVKTFLAPAAGALKAFFQSFRTGMTEDEGTPVERLALSLRSVLPPLIGFIRGQFIPALQGIVGAGQRLAAVVLPILKAIAAEFLRNWPIIKPVVMEIFSTIRGIVLDVMGYIKVTIERVTKVISFIWSRWGKQITSIVGSTFRTVIRVLGGAFKIIGGLVKVVTGILTGDWKKAGDGVKQIIRGLVQIAVAIFKNWMSVTHALLGNLVVKLKERWNNFLEFTRNRLRSGLAAVKEFILAPVRAARDGISSLMDRIRDRFASGVAAIGRAWNGLKEAAKAPIRFVVDTVINRGLIGAFNKIARVIPGVGELPNVSAGFYRGGPTGRGNDHDIAGYAHKNEHYATAAEVRKTPGGHSTWERMRGLIRRGVTDWLPGVGPGYFLGGGVAPTRIARMSRHSGYPWARWAGDLNGPGNDFGQSVHAYKAGVVAAVKRWGHSYGNHIRINHGGERSLYAHLSKILVAPGQRVSAGQPIGAIGNSGNSFGAHLHFELAGGSGPLDVRVMRAAGGAATKVAAWVKAGFSSVKDWMTNLVGKPLAQLRELNHGPLGRLVGGVARRASSGLIDHIGKFDQGGELRPGLTLAYNGTGRNEQVVRPGGGGYHDVHMHFPSSPNAEVLHAAAGGRLVAALAARGW